MSLQFAPSDIDRDPFKSLTKITDNKLPILRSQAPLKNFSKMAHLRTMIY